LILNPYNFVPLTAHIKLEIYYSNEYSLGYLNEKTQLKKDYFLKIMTSNHYLDIETNKNKSARLDLNKLNFKSK